MRLDARAIPLPPDNSARGPHETDPLKVRRYASDMRGGAVFPAVRLVDYGEGALMIVDGHHRIAAARIAETTLIALVVDGDAFEDLDATLRTETDRSRADDEEFWHDPR